jgi:hypothetical protein
VTQHNEPIESQQTLADFRAALDLLGDCMRLECHVSHALSQFGVNDRDLAAGVAAVMWARIGYGRIAGVDLSRDYPDGMTEELQ